MIDGPYHLHHETVWEKLIGTQYDNQILKTIQKSKHECIMWLDVNYVLERGEMMTLADNPLTIAIYGGMTKDNGKNVPVLKVKYNVFKEIIPPKFVFSTTKSMKLWKVENGSASVIRDEVERDTDGCYINPYTGTIVDINDDDVYFSDLSELDIVHGTAHPNQIEAFVAEKYKVKEGMKTNDWKETSK